MDFSTMPLPVPSPAGPERWSSVWQLPLQGIRPTYPGFPVEVAFTG
jgi:hypothetical protein